MPLFPNRVIQNILIGNIQLRDHHAATAIVGHVALFFEPATFAALAGSHSGW